MRVGMPTEGPLFPDDGPVGPRLWRRVRGISLEIVAFVLVTRPFPRPAAGRRARRPAPVDPAAQALGRRPPRRVRCGGSCSARCGRSPALLGIWVVHRRAVRHGLAAPHPLYLRACASHWSRSHLGGIRALFGLRFEVEGLELAGPGPAVIMMRHASIVDNLLPDVFIGRTHGIGLRFVHQARAADDPDDRHRRALGADLLRAPRLGRHGGRDRRAPHSRPRPRAPTRRS